MKTLLKLFVLFFLLAPSFNANCQIKVDLKKKVVNQSNNKANQNADQAVGKGLDAIENGVKGVFRKKDKTGDAQQNQTSDASTGNDNNVAGSEGKNAAKATPELEAYSKYDFIPGEKVIFYEDFSQDAVGDFPALWNTNGSGEVVTTNLFPGKWMRFGANDCIWTDDLLKLPDNYTVEFDVIPVAGVENRMVGYNIRLMQAYNAKAWDGGSAPGNGGFYFGVEYTGRPHFHTWLNKTNCQPAALNGYKDGDAYKEKQNEKYHIAIWIQKSRIRLYQNQDKLVDLPKAIPPDCMKIDRLRFEYGAAMVSNIRIAVGAPDMRNKLITEGKLVSYGIYFDVNKDIVKPESYGTLKEIAATLTENPDVRIKIVGYTDSDGADAANLDLSKRRGAAVKDELAKSFGIDASRIESDGMGEAQPVAPNDTPANKALNRRVEFVKL